MNSLTRAALKAYQAIVPRSIRPRTRAEKALIRTSGGRVLGGPFKGMTYHPPGVGDAWHQRVLGTYELEVNDVLEHLLRRSPSRIVNVGAADGYYAAGLALRAPDARVIAFEMLETKHDSIHSLAAMNSVGDRVDVRSKCGQENLAAAIGDAPRKCLIVIDVEGAELDLLDPGSIPSLADVSILAEIHESLRPGLSVQLEARFASTHQIVKIDERARLERDLPFAPGWLRPWMLSMALEHRAIRQQWWAFIPRANIHGAPSHDGLQNATEGLRAR